MMAINRDDYFCMVVNDNGFSDGDDLFLLITNFMMLINCLIRIFGLMMPINKRS